MNSRPWRHSVLVAIVVSLLPALAGAADRPDDEPAVRAVAQVLPAVVNINTERIVRRTVHDPYDLMFYNFFGGPMRPPRQMSATVQSLGSGFIVDPEGYIITNEHVVERAADLKIQVTLQDGTTYRARYIAGDAGSDLALIKVDAPEPLPSIDLTDLSPNLLGQTVIVLGNPLGYGSSVSRGILSATKRTVSLGDLEYSDLVQTDAAINPGNSGGPIIDIGGRLVGISSVKMAYTPDGTPTQGIGFGIPAALVREKLVELKKIAQSVPAVPAATAARKFFGLQLQDLTDDLARALGSRAGRGVLVADVEPGSPAGDAGFERGLVIYKVGRYEVSSVAEIEGLFGRVRAGTVVDLLVGSTPNPRGLQKVQTVALTAR